MSLTDPLADMFTRIRNAAKALHPEVRLPASKEKIAIAEVLKQEGYIADFTKEKTSTPQDDLVISLKYGQDKEPAIDGIERVSKTSRRVYVGAKEIPRILGGLGIVILSTSEGIITGQEARKRNCGGEILCKVW